MVQPPQQQAQHDTVQLATRRGLAALPEVSDRTLRQLAVTVEEEITEELVAGLATVAR